MEQENKEKKKGLLPLVIILSILVLATVGYLLYDKVLNKKDVDEGKENTKTEVKLLTAEEAIIEGKKIYDKATEIYETWVLTPYCGVTLDNINEERVEVLGDGGYGNGRYYKSDFNSLDALKDYLKQWLSEDIINDKVIKNYELNGETYYKYVEDLSLLSKQDTHYGYVNYVLKDNTLYCRLDTGKGWLTLYQDKYDIKVDNIEENKITYTITSTYGKPDSGCYLGMTDISPCSEEKLEYKDTTFIVERNETGNFIVTEYKLHN